MEIKKRVAKLRIIERNRKDLDTKEKDLNFEIKHYQKLIQEQNKVSIIQNPNRPISFHRKADI